MKYVFGLGNPGRKYEHTRHNAGFDVVNILAARFGIRMTMKDKLDARYGDGIIGRTRAALVEPQTFMNASGFAVSAVLDYFDASPSDIIVVYDDIDIPFGTIRIREKGSAGTHNGMRSIVDCLGTNSFLRVRVGVGKPEGQIPLAAYVLSRFPDSDAAQLLMNRGADAVMCVLEEGVQKAQQAYHSEQPGSSADKKQSSASKTYDVGEIG